MEEAKSFKSEVEEILAKQALALNYEYGMTSRILGTDPGWTIDVGDPEISKITKPDSTPIRQDSPEITAGEERQVETAQDGFDAEIKREVETEDGTVIDTYMVSSTYSATSNRILVGTGQ